MAAKNTRRDRSLRFMMLKIPTKKADTPEAPARIPVNARVGLLKNVIPPRWPEAARTCSNANNKKKTIINPADHLPRRVFGIVSSFTSYEPLALGAGFEPATISLHFVLVFPLRVDYILIRF